MTVGLCYCLCDSFGNNLVTHHYYQEKMRPHLRKCLLDRKLKLFPHKTICPSGNFYSVEKLAVYCLCRMPEIKGQPMVECSKCKEWYHFVCEKFTPKSLTKNDEWYCTHCMTDQNLVIIYTHVAIYVVSISELIFEFILDM